MGLLKSLVKDVLGRGKAASPATPDAAAVDPAPALARQYRESGPDARTGLVSALEQRVLAEPDAPTLRRLLADWLLDLGRLDEAEGHYRQALQRMPTDARSHEGLGLCLLRKGQVDEAYLRLESAAKLAPGDADIWVHWGLADLETGNVEHAAGKFRNAVDRGPDNPHAWHNLALAMLVLGQVDGSLAHFERAIALKPDHALAHGNFAMALMQADQLARAEAMARRATELKPDQPRGWVILADVLTGLARFAEAEQALDQALHLNISTVGPWLGKAKLFMSQGRLTEAEQAFEQALAVDPDNAEAQGGLGQLRLLLGRWESAWRLFEARKRTPSSPVRNFPLPDWQGDADRHERLLVHAEQGLGDIILFGSCLPDLARRCDDVVIEVPPRMAGLFARSFPWAEVIGHDQRDPGMGWLASTRPPTRQIAIGSLPLWLRQREQDFPPRGAFLVADPERTRRWREQLARGDGRPVIGITWRGGLAITGRQMRSLPLSRLVQALSATGARLVCLQHGDVAEDLARCAAETGITVEPGLSGYVDLDDLAALTMACDGVVTVCSTQAHLTGALGQKGLVLVPRSANWRYGWQGTDMVWYPGLTLTRQALLGDWQEPIGRAHDWVRGLASDNVSGNASASPR